jgi:transglutaminase-like putative cysteine protease
VTALVRQRFAAAPETGRLLWTAVIVVGASLPHWSALPVWMPVLLLGCVAWRLLAAVGGWRPAGRAVRLLLALIVFAAVVLRYRTVNGVAAGSALLVVMVALKFVESRQDRDQIVLIMIAYFLMFASLPTERSPLTGVYLLVLVWLTTVGLLQIGRRGPLLPARATARLAGRLLLLSLPFAVALFVLFPRLPGPLWAIPGSTSSGASGLSDTMSPGDITELGLSDEVAFRVQFTTAPPAPSELYWRGPVMSDFDGRTWSMSPGMRRNVANTIEYKGTPTEYRVMLEPNDRGWAFALDMPQTWSGEPGLRMGSDYQLGVFFGRGRGRRLDYHVRSFPQYVAREPLSEREQRQFRRLPPDSSPRTRALVATWLTDGPTPEQIIERAMDYLRSQPFQYTLTPPKLGAQPVDEFLFDTREGFCEHYASAFAVMMRAAGLPARVVTGYQGGELNSLGEYYIIRQSEAHAWTEVWLGDRGWVRVDPIVAVAPERVTIGSWRGSLAGGTQPGTAFGRLRWIRYASLLWDAGRTYWNAWVVGYGPELQRALLESLGLTTTRSQRWTTLMLLAVAATVTLLLALALYLAWARGHGRPADPAARSFALFTRRLTRRKVAPRRPAEAPAAYAARAAAALPGAAAEIAAIAAAYLRARYEPDVDAAALRELRARVKAFHPAAG